MWYWIIEWWIRIGIIRILWLVTKAPKFVNEADVGFFRSAAIATEIYVCFRSRYMRIVQTN